jgi:hypothetical protein
MLRWINQEWRPIIECQQGRLTYLLLDDFGVHLTENVAKAFLELNTEVDI